MRSGWLGLFINSLPLCVHVPAELSLSAWLRSLHQMRGAMAQHEATSLSQNPGMVGRSASAQADTLFDTLVVFENYPVDESVSAAGSMTIDHIEGTERTHYPLTLTISPGERGEPLQIEWARDAARLSAADVTALAESFGAFLSLLARLDDPLLSELALPTHLNAVPMPTVAVPFHAVHARIVMRCISDA